MDTYFPLVRKRLTPSSVGKILNPTPSLMTENVSTMLGSWTTETLRKVKSVMNNEAVLTNVPIVTIGTADTVKSSIVPMGTNQAASTRHSEPVPILAHGTASVITNEVMLTVTRVTSPIMTTGALPVRTSGTAKSTNAIAPAMITETAQIVNTMPFWTSETTSITSTGVQDGITRDGISIMTSEPAFNDTSEAVPINSNDTAYVTPRETDIVSSETGHRDQ
ncbi:hypothetical protein scyTo_0015846 [Scyliorhinus torazame]|uniref:Uncharacterized protein n=1 Tax=Scyliorhinus torazame TaxID=75743 RepID=A0A401PZM9_SCYTO|nr:hypothetical protein [Scyliorhinus torazame]